MKDPITGEKELSRHHGQTDAEYRIRSVLYSRVWRLKRLTELHAPTVILAKEAMSIVTALIALDKEAIGVAFMERMEDEARRSISVCVQPGCGNVLPELPPGPDPTHEEVITDIIRGCCETHKDERIKIIKEDLEHYGDNDDEDDDG